MRSIAQITFFCFQFQDMSSSESNGHEPFELTAADMSPLKVEVSAVEKSAVMPKMLFPRKKSIEDNLQSPHRHFIGDTPFEETHKAAMKMVSVVSPPKIRQNVAQLNSQNREAHRIKIAQMNKPSTWAEAVQNVAPKVTHLSNFSAVEQNIVEHKNVPENGKVVSCDLPSNCDKENSTPSVLVEKDKIECVDLKKVEFEQCNENGQTENSPIWILPAEDEETKKKKKNKNKNKKKVSNI